jgi:hypothetical protein
VDSPAFDRVIALANSTNIDHRRESLFVLCNGVTGCDFILRKQILERGGNNLIATLIKGLYIQDPRILKNIIECLDSLLSLDTFYDWKHKDTSVAYMVEVNDGLNALDEVQKHPSRLIYDLAYKLLETHFQQEDSQRMDMASDGFQNNNNGN